jgi:hypothetical protein
MVGAGREERAWTGTEVDAEGDRDTEERRRDRFFFITLGAGYFITIGRPTSNSKLGIAYIIP